MKKDARTADALVQVAAAMLQFNVALVALGGSFKAMGAAVDGELPANQSELLAEMLESAESKATEMLTALVQCRQQVEAGNAGAAVSVQRDRAQA